jgi:sugar/nucleoside kinase (ribokinase family)
MFKMKKDEQLDFLAVGDITTDAFIHLATGAAGSAVHSVCTDAAKEHCELCLPFPDKIPFDKVVEVKGVGNSANAAVSAARLGLRSALVTTVGDDAGGRDCIAELSKNAVDTGYVTVEKGVETNYHYALWFETDRTILIKHHEYHYTLPEKLKNLSQAPRWMYLSSLASNSYEYHLEIIEYLKKNPSIKLAFQPGTFQMKLGIEKLGELYRRTDVFIVNVEESQLILNTKDENLEVLLHDIYKLGPKLVLITDGPNGAYMYDGEHSYFMPIYPDVKAPYERTGCGDAFSSTFIAALTMGKTALEAFTWAPINSMSVVEYVGAQEGLLSRPVLEDFLKKAPANYKPVIYNSFLKSQP